MISCLSRRRRRRDRKNTEYSGYEKEFAERECSSARGDANREDINLNEERVRQPWKIDKNTIADAEMAAEL